MNGRVDGVAEMDAWMTNMNKWIEGKSYREWMDGRGE